MMLIYTTKQSFRMMLLLLVGMMLFSCESTESKNKTISVYPNDLYDYLDGYATNKICNSDSCIEYLEIWKTLFISNNRVDESFIENHIQVGSTSIQEISKGLYFHVGYFFQMDWGKAYSTDGFYVFFNEDSKGIPSSIPREKYLNEYQISTLLGTVYGMNNISIISNEALIFPSVDAALTTLANHANVTSLGFNRMFIDDETGHIQLEASGQYVTEENLCVFGTIDLVTGESDFYDSACIIYN